MTFMIIAIVVLVIVYIIMYNGLILKKNQVKNAFSGMDVQLKKRYDLIPNLVAAVQQYVEHESGTLTKLTELRSRAMSPTASNEEKMQIANETQKTLGGLMVQVENYPDLKASANFLDLQRSLNEIEEQIAAARRFYNSAVMDLNNAIQMFPSNIVAGMMGLKEEKMFEIVEQERQNVDVKEMFNR
ncbi:MAG TPA: LemA family protein [Clostridiales bacterium]|nr:MAG: LemA family protein [Clostridiales bacterium GWD2_32_19]HCC07988.1 LemA family protein [Clostridiales bacterium]